MINIIKEVLDIDRLINLFKFKLDIKFMNDLGIIILLSIFGLVLLICLYWCLIHSRKSRNVNNRTRWDLVKFVNNNPEVLPV